MFDYLASLDAVRADAPYFHLPARGRDAPKLALMGAPRGKAGYHLVASGYLVLYGGLRVREGFADASSELLDSFHTTYVPFTSGLVAYVVWGVDLISSVEVPIGGKDLLNLPAR